MQLVIINKSALCFKLELLLYFLPATSTGICSIKLSTDHVRLSYHSEPLISASLLWASLATFQSKMVWMDLLNVVWLRN